MENFPVSISLKNLCLKASLVPIKRRPIVRMVTNLESLVEVNTVLDNLSLLEGFHTGWSPLPPALKIS